MVAMMEVEYYPVEWSSLFPWAVLGFLCLITVLLMLMLLVVIIRRNR
jgi:hypothetical protein